MASLMNADSLPDALVPFKEKLSPRFFEVRKQVIQFANEVVIPRTAEYVEARRALQKEFGELTAPQPPVLRELRDEAKKRGLWNFFLPEVCGLTVLEYSPIAEILGAIPLMNISMNCSAPDTGNMEVLEKFGNAYQKEKFLKPLLNADIRSCFAMTEPGVASSDATNISTRIDRDGDEYVVNGHKWYISGAIRPECKLAILLGKTRFDGPRHLQQSMIVVDMDSPGVNILRPCSVFGHEGDHAEIIFDNVRVPAANMILGEGRGFEIAQGRLGPGRIHHCMRSIGTAEIALEAIIHRANNRRAFGQILAKKDTLRKTVAECRIEIECARQLTYLAACMADEHGFKAARKYIAMIKYKVPRVALMVCDEAIQVHGAHGVSQDSKLSDMWTGLRTLRVADGPDIVHLNTIAKMEINRPVSAMGAKASGTNKNITKYGKYDHVKEIAFPKPSVRASL